MVSAARSRLARGALPWRQLATVLAAIAVIVAMVGVAQTARRDEAHHQQVQVLVEQVRSNSRELGEYIWQVLAQAFASRDHEIQARAFASHALAVWFQLNQELRALRALDHSASTRVLGSDATRVYDAGMSLMPLVTGNVAGAQRGLEAAQTVFMPALNALDRGSVAASALQARVARQAAQRAGVAYVGSLVVGLLLLVLLGFQLYRISRRSLVAEERRFVEQRAERRIRALVEHSSDLIVVLGPDLTVRWQSTSVHWTLGAAGGGLIGRRVGSIAHPDDVSLLESHLTAVMRQTGSATVTARFADAAGGWRHLEVIADNRLADPEVEGIVLSMRDVSERKALEDELRHQAFHDSLTGLANRALFEDRLAHCLAGARRHQRQAAVLFLDLDNFKTINDSLGHASGDELLLAVAKRIAVTARVTDTAARLGGDEFAILLETLDEEGEAQLMARRLLDALAPAFAVAERELRVTASIGVAVSDGSRGVEDLLRNADTAMYAAKEAGKGTIQSFEEGMHERVLARLELTEELQRGLEREEFEIDYQPIVELQRGQVIGCEALIRWAHPTRGRMSPAEFIGLAEETGLIVPLGRWILFSACRQAALWQRLCPDRELEINVNVSTRQLHDASFTDSVAQALRETGLPAHLLVLEITESVLPDDDDEIIERLHALKALGLRIAVDDFGTGYSALSRLQDYPVDVLKIDRSFINGIEHDPGKEHLVRGILDLGRSLEMTVVAEGIEQPEQADQLRRLRSPLGQGYLISRPVGPERLEALLCSQSLLAGVPRAADPGPEPVAQP